MIEYLIFAGVAYGFLDWMRSEHTQHVVQKTHNAAFKTPVAQYGTSTAHGRVRKEDIERVDMIEGYVDQHPRYVATTKHGMTIEFAQDPFLVLST